MEGRATQVERSLIAVLAAFEWCKFPIDLLFSITRFYTASAICVADFHFLRTKRRFNGALRSVLGAGEAVQIDMLQR